MPGRVMPNNLEAEQSVLGACFLSKQALQKACDILNPEYFYDERNGKVFSAMQDLVNEKVPIDLTTITGKLKKDNKLSEVGGVEYLTELVNFVPTASNIDYYINNVEESFVVRNLIQTATDIATSGYQNDDDVNTLLDEAERKILSIKKRQSGEFRSIKEVLSKTQANLEKLYESKGEITGLASGFYEIDKLTSGFHENEFIIIAARPAMGKTAFALNLATNIATSTNKAVALFNLEMDAEQLATRMLSSLGQVEGHKLRTGKLLNDDWNRIYEAISQIENTNIFIDDNVGNLTVGEIKAKCRRLANSDEGLGIVIIDYLQLLSGGKNYGSNRQQEVSDISRSLKTLAMELHVPIIALAQLSRAVEGREDKRPLMSDLRESGSIEQDADIVSFLYREDYYNKEKRREDDISISEFIIGKHRNGTTATVELLFKKNTSTFLNMRKEYHKEEE